MGWPYQQKPPMGWPLDYDSGLVPEAGFWLMNDSLEDLSGNGNTGTFGGNPQWVSGDTGLAIDFDGDDCINIGSKSVLKLNQFTLIVKAKTDDFTRALNGGVAQGDLFGNALNVSYEISFHNSNIIATVTSTDVTKHQILDAAIGDNNWHTWALVYDGTNVILYKDGLQTGTPTTSPDVDYIVNHLNFDIGARDDGTLGIDGQIEFVMVYNRGLSASEIALIYRYPFWMFKDPAEVALLGAHQVVGAAGIMTTNTGYWGPTF